jgi:hypothetical protein
MADRRYSRNASSSTPNVSASSWSSYGAGDEAEKFDECHICAAVGMLRRSLHIV